MQLKLRRSQRAAAILLPRVYILDARAELTPDEKTLVVTHSLGKIPIYDSEARKKRVLAAQQLSGGGLLGTLGSIASSALAAMSLRITIDSLVAGHHIECKTMDELFAAEVAIREGCETLRTFLDLAVTFDGREETMEF